MRRFKQLGAEVVKLSTDEVLRNSLSNNIERLAVKDSAQKIAKEIIELSGK